MNEKANGAEFKQGHFQGEVMARLGAIDAGVAECHAGLQTLKESLQAHVLKESGFMAVVQKHVKDQDGEKRRSDAKTAGISGVVAGAMVGAKLFYDWLKGG